MSKKIFNAIVPPFDTIQDDLADLDTKNHSDLDQLAWSVAGHTIDTDLDLAGNDILNVGDLFINATIDHKIYDTSDDLYIENLNSNKDILLRVNDGGTSYTMAELDSSDGIFRLYPSPSADYGLTGLFNITGDFSAVGISGAIAFNPTVTGGTFWIPFLAQPLLNTSAATIAFYFDPEFGATYNQTVHMLRLAVPPHKPNYSDEYKMAGVVDTQRAFISIGVEDSSTIDYKWIALGGAISGGDAAVSNAPVFTEEMVKLSGGVSRFLGSLGNFNQTGLLFSGFSTQSGLIAGTDSCYAMYADGGWFAHKYDYVYTGAAGPNQGIFMGAGTDSGIGFDGADFRIDTDLQGAGALPRFNSASNWSANNAQTVTLGNVGPGAAALTVQKWLTVKDNAGNTYYVPAFG